MKGARVVYSETELAWIKACSDIPRTELHRLFVQVFDRPAVTVDNIKALCTRRGWRAAGDGRFVKGHATHNKGKAMPFHPNSAATRFKKGQIPHSWRGAGHERIDKKMGYIMMIVAETNPWTGAATRPVLKHKYLWEKLNGPLPKGHCLKSLDGNRLNTDPSNWVAIPRGLLPRLNGIYGRDFDHAPAELKPTILAVAKLEHAAREARKPRKEAIHD